MPILYLNVTGEIDTAYYKYNRTIASGNYIIHLYNIIFMNK